MVGFCVVNLTHNKKSKAVIQARLITNFNIPDMQWSWLLRGRPGKRKASFCLLAASCGSTRRCCVGRRASRGSVSLSLVAWDPPPVSLVSEEMPLQSTVHCTAEYARCGSRVFMQKVRSDVTRRRRNYAKLRYCAMGGCLTSLAASL